MHRTLLWFLVLSLCASLTDARIVAAGESPPKVLLLGDSIREGYAPFVAELLAGKAIAISSADNGQDCREILARCDRIIAQQPDVIHLNTGLRDLAIEKKSGAPRASLALYEENLRQIVQRLQRETKARLYFATTTPVIDQRHAARKIEIDRFEADVERYNHVALRVMKELGVPVNDLHALVVGEGPEKLIDADGVHYGHAGSQRLARAVSDFLTEQLAKGRAEEKDNN